ncbi:MAG: trypsin-like peptidase domain-containing protein [Akkermansiaceae bacterium]|jgi:Do/DeqQ family serine protease|nr:trypsin-like peptidase domain-containing protein [Akkermansiaceae bacterium]
MNRGLRSLLALFGVFIGTFLVVFLIRNGPDGIRRLFRETPTPDGYRPEAYTLPDKAPLELDDVELLSRLNEEYAKLTDAVVRSVVSIDTSSVRAERLLDGFGRQFVRPVPTQGQGSGVIVTREGHVVTNHHVIKDQQKIMVTLHDGRSYKANLINSDPLLDIAVLKIDGGDSFEPLKFGDSSEVRRGQIVFAIGNPFGLGETITQGIISARERSVSDTQRDLFQTDAAINPGNSGGPLVNLRGEIVGINSAIYRPDQRVNSGFQGVGFSIPSNDVREALEAILQRGQPIRGYLGVRMQDLDDYWRERLSYEDEGALVASVGEGSPAEAAGLKGGDIIRSFNGQPISSRAALFTLVQRAKVGEEIELEIWREGDVSTVPVTIAEARPENPEVSAPDVEETFGRVGLTLEQPDDGQPGLVVRRIEADTISAGRLIVGDRIMVINGQMVTDLAEFRRQLAASVVAQATTLQIIRGGVAGRLTLPPLDDPSGNR